MATAIKLVCNAIEGCQEWEWSKDKDYEAEQAKAPYEFRYQSVHYIVRCREGVDVGEMTVAAGAPCEVQVRTLLQHAHSELTHDTIYKPSVVQTPEMLRAAAKSMALIEATGDYFEELVDQIAKAVGANRKLTEELIGVYRDRVGREPDVTRAEGLLNEAYAALVGTNAVADISAFLAEKAFVAERIKERAQNKLLFRQPFRHWLDDGPHLGALRGARRTQDRHHRRPARHMIDVHRRKAALVVMRVPERELLGAMRRAKGIVDIEDLQLVRLHSRAELIEQSCGEPRRLRRSASMVFASGSPKQCRIAAIRTASGMRCSRW
jgi:hypothetical protein